MGQQVPQLPRHPPDVAAEEHMLRLMRARPAVSILREEMGRPTARLVDHQEYLGPALWAAGSPHEAQQLPPPLVPRGPAVQVGFVGWALVQLGQRGQSALRGKYQGAQLRDGFRHRQQVAWVEPVQRLLVTEETVGLRTVP